MKTKQFKVLLSELSPTASQDKEFRRLDEILCSKEGPKIRKALKENPEEIESILSKALKSKMLASIITKRLKS